MAESTARPPAGDGAPNYWARRAGALALCAVVAFALVRAGTAMIGSDDGSSDDTIMSADADADEAAVTTAAGDSSAEDSDGTDDIGVSDDSNDSVAPVTAQPVEATTQPAAEPRPPGPPTAENPAHVFIVGDSDAGTFGPYLETLLDATTVASTKLDYKVSSGLARPDFFDWPAELEQQLPLVDPDIVVVTFGGNDAQGLSLPQEELEFMIGDPVENEAAWSEEYQRRAGEVMDLLLENDRRVIWVGIPNDDNPEVTAKLAIQDTAAKAAAAERPGVVFIDTWRRFSGRDGNWAEFVIDPRDNTGKDVRADDGFHLNQNGAEILAIDIALEVQTALRELGADL